MRRVFDAWAAHAAARLQGAAAMAAGEAAAAYHSSRLAVRAWRAWRQYLAQVGGGSEGGGGRSSFGMVMSACVLNT